VQANSSTSNFKKNSFIIIKLIAFLIALSVILIYIGEYFESISHKNQNSTYAKQALNTFYNEKKQVDLVFLGSSHSYCTFDPEYFDQYTKYYSYQLGTPLQHPDTSYYMLKEILNYQKPKIVVFEIYWDMLDDEFELKQADMLLTAVHNDGLKKEYIKNVFPLNEKVKYYFKPVRYQQDAFAYFNKNLTDFVNRYKIDRAEVSENGVEFYRDRGFLYTEKIISPKEFNETNQFLHLDGDKWAVSSVQKKYIMNLKQLCDQNDIDLYFVTAPIANVSMEYIKNYDIIHNTISEFSKSLGVDYIDYNSINKDEELLVNDDFYDDAHLNNKGAVIVQKHFINWLKAKRGEN
jgi:hypothetical protein